MAGSWRTPRGSIAFTGAMGLILLSLLLFGLSPVWNDAAPAHPAGTSSSPAWTAGASDAGLTSLPPQATSVREHHVLSLWPPLRGDRQGEHAHLALLTSPGADTDAIRDPQQLGHRTAGSRSPPLT
ncbi:hypothetical protein E1286_10330 [Nonomuraea terrae]|uniref:Uncharacterized protein n=1 Tax=Nonomuraea terrae TaxID=2530383 RepID=A0A4R4Z119_9ACTN|nr:hypothetical protein [Nonomuraea terrae]TDD51565.1 hypothetical protein E1286_10330 [Nonomuraea terrae]